MVIFCTVACTKPMVTNRTTVKARGHMFDMGDRCHWQQINNISKTCVVVVTSLCAILCKAVQLCTACHSVHSVHSWVPYLTALYRATTGCYRLSRFSRV